MNYTAIRAFHAVARHGGFTAAAERLHVSQPTLSGQVGELERRYGVALFEREGRAVRLTALGRELFAATGRLFAGVDEIEALLRGAKGLACGELAIFADAPHHALPLVATFEQRYPGVAVGLEFGNTASGLARLLAGDIDIAILPRPPADGRLMVQPLLTDRLVAIAAAGFERRAARLADLADAPLILREEGSSTRALVESALAREGLAAPRRRVLEGREAVREAVAAGLGVGFVNRGEVGRDDRVAVIELTDLELRIEECLIARCDRRARLAIDAFFAAAPPAGPSAGGP